MIAVVSAWDTGMDALAEAVWPNRQEYCRRHGYDCLRGTVCTSDRHPAWLKVPALQEYLPHYERVFWMDLDAVITNMSIKLEHFFYSDMAITQDVNGFNCGMMMMKNTPWSLEFLARWWSVGQHFGHHASPEQVCCASLLLTEPKDKWTCFSQRVFNSYEYTLYPQHINPVGQWSDGDFVLHLPAVPNLDRIRIFKEHLCL